MIAPFRSMTTVSASTSTSTSTAGTLSPEFLLALREIALRREFSPGTALFHQGSGATGVHVVENGEVRILLPTGQNQNQLLEVVGSGAVLGLSASLSGANHRITAEAGIETTVAFVARRQFLEFLSEHCDYSMEIVRLVSQELHGLYHKYRSITAHPGRPRQRALDEQLN